MWERSPDTTPRVWQAAVIACIGRVVANRAGWRAPSIQGLLTLVDLGVASGLALPPGHPFSNVQETRYWSATLVADGNFAEAEKTILWPVWCVRGGLGVNLQ